MRITGVIGITTLVVAAACGGGSGYTTSSMSGGGGGGGGATPNPVMSGTAFSPALDTVAIGATVTWTNQDPVTHTVTYASGPDAAFDSGSIPPNGTFQHTFQTAGTYVYYCQIHGTPTAGMRGTIVVK